VLLVRVGRGRHDLSGPTTIVRPSGYLVDPDSDPSNPSGLSPFGGGPAAGYGVGTIAPISPAFGGPLDRLAGPGRATFNAGPPALDAGPASLTNGPAGLAGGSATLTGDASAGGLTVPLLPGDHTTARRLAFLAVNACTLASLSLGVCAIFLAMQADVRAAAACLIACVTFDGLDGALARRLGVASPFGAQMDSLADMCSFGLAAPVVVYASLSSTVSTPVAGATCALVAACAAIRLARFNVSPKDGRFFCGVPTTMAAAVLALSVLIDLPVAGRFQLAGVALLAVAMVSSFPYAKLARLAKLPAWLWVVPLSGALVDVRLTFVSLVVCYLASGPLLWLHQRRP
jgi:CDP-diacylglycerol--serine O-phosphatidyltransferase